MQPMEAETGDPVDPRELVSSDDEVDYYSVDPKFYDPNVNDVYERWVNKQRKCQTSNTVLSCPACFTTLFLYCQREMMVVVQQEPWTRPMVDWFVDVGAYLLAMKFMGNTRFFSS